MISDSEELVCTFDNLNFLFHRMVTLNKDLFIECRFNRLYNNDTSEDEPVLHYNCTIKINDKHKKKRYPVIGLLISSIVETRKTVPFVTKDNMNEFIEVIEAEFGQELILTWFGKQRDGNYVRFCKKSELDFSLPNIPKSLEFGSR